MNTCLKFQSLATAVESAINISTGGYASIVLSKGEYYVEDTDCPFIRVGEEHIATYQNGELIKS